MYFFVLSPFKHVEFIQVAIKILVKASRKKRTPIKAVLTRFENQGLGKVSRFIENNGP